MDTLKATLEAGSSTVAWSVVNSALEQQRHHASAREDAAASVSLGGSLGGPRLHLDSAPLWKQFFSVTNEMIVTKAGRRMFPVLKLHISHLEPSALYAVVLEFRCTHQHRWRFLNGNWQKGSACEDNADLRHAFVHFTAVAPGSQWMQEPVSFAKLKLSNRENGTSKIRLNSLHKYQPYIHLVKMNKGTSDQPLQIKSFTFPETQFIAVTAYQNDKVTQMKIKNNPFAKAFLGGNASERVHSSSYVPPLELQHALITPLLPPQPHNLTPPPPPYPGPVSSHQPDHYPWPQGFQYLHPMTPQIQSQQNTPPIVSHEQQFCQDYHGCIEVYDSVQATCSNLRPSQSCLYDNTPYYASDFNSGYLAETPSLYLHDGNVVNNPLPTTPSDASTTSAASDQCYFTGFHQT